MSDKYDTDSDDYDADSDNVLQCLFQEMRSEDAAQAPAFPDAALLAARPPADADHRSYFTMPRFVAAAAMAAVAIILLREPVPQDPAVLYAQVMNDNSIATDTLLSVSPVTLPGMLGIPDVYDPEVAAGAGQGVNQGL